MTKRKLWHSCHIPVFTVQLERDRRHSRKVWYDGPAEYGPRAIREHPRDMNWSGNISAARANMLISKARAHGYKVDCT